MERKIYLVRHGEPDPGTISGKIYLGRKNIPLLESSEENCRLLGQYFRKMPIDTIAASPLLRCQQTAKFLLEGMQSDLSVQIIDDFQEVDTGIWDGKTFKEVRESFPQEYEERGEHPGRKAFPGGESLEQAGKRFVRGMEQLISDTEGSILAVAHAGVIRAFLCLITGRDIDQLLQFQIPYASITELVYSENGWEVVCVGFCPAESMTVALVEKFWDACKVTEEQRAHMKRTAELALQLIGYDTERRERCGLESEYAVGGTILNASSIFYGGMLHDLMRSAGRGHEEFGAEWIDKKGFSEIARVVRLHNNPEVLQEIRPLDEAEVIYYADKRTKGDMIVTLDERFAMSRHRLKTQEAREMYRRRLETAKKIEEKLMELMAPNCIYPTNMV